MQTNEIGKLINSFAYESYACDWDNTGFNINLNSEVKGILICLDVTKTTITEAKNSNCNLIISHHPLLFNKINKIDTTDYVGECVQLLIANGISLYCAHTSMDGAKAGINYHLANALNLTNLQFLQPTYTQEYCKLTVYVPKINQEEILKELSKAGAGEVGNYSGCTFTSEGQGRFTPNEFANAAIGSANKQEVVEEVEISCICQKNKVQEITSQIKKVHPYEEPAIDVFEEYLNKEVLAGMGVMGECEEISCKTLLDKLKKEIETDCLRFSGELDKKVTKVAICGGGGGDLIRIGAKMGAQLFITGEIKHNYYLEKNIALVEAGHYDTEKCFLKLMYNSLQKCLNDVQYNIDVYVSKTESRAYINY